MSYTGKVSKITGCIHYFDIKREQGDYKKVFKETRRIKLLDDDIGKSVLLYKEIVNLGRKIHRSQQSSEAFSHNSIQI